MSGPVLLPGEQPLPLSLRSKASLSKELIEKMAELEPLLAELQSRSSMEPGHIPRMRLIKLLASG